MTERFDISVRTNDKGACVVDLWYSNEFWSDHLQYKCVTQITGIFRNHITLPSIEPYLNISLYVVTTISCNIWSSNMSIY